MSIIEDGKGRGYKQSVSSSQRGNVSSKSNPRMYYVSREKGQAFSFLSEYSATSGDFIGCVMNTSSDKNFVVSEIIVGGVEAGHFEVVKVTGTPAGTTITGGLLNFSKSNTAEATAFGDAAVTGLTEDYELSHIRTQASESKSMSFQQSLILSKDTAIGIKYVGTTGLVEITILGYFEDHSGQTT